MKDEMRTLKISGCIKETTSGYIKPECPFVRSNNDGRLSCAFGSELIFTVLYTTPPDDCPLRKSSIEIQLEIKRNGKITNRTL